MHKAIWRKMSKFNFAVSEESDYYTALLEYISWLEKVYGEETLGKTN